MSTASILIGLSMLIVTLPLVIGPLLNKKRTRAAPAGSGRAEEDDYQEALLALRDLEFDHGLGIVAGDDYARLQAQLMAQAARTRRGAQGAATEGRSEALVPAHPRTTESHKATSVDEQIEASVKSRRQTGKKQACAACHTALQPGAQFCPQCGTAVLNLCAHCRRPYEAGDRFCAACGSPLESNL